MEITKKNITSLLIPIALFTFVSMLAIWYHTIKIIKLEKDIIVLKEEMSMVCDAGMKTVEGLMNNQDGLTEAFKEIQKLKQAQKGIIYH